MLQGFSANFRVVTTVRPSFQTLEGYGVSAFPSLP
jgi:hypothetical protein